MFGKRVGLLCVSAIVVLNGCASDDDNEDGLVWSTCESSTTLECATLQVPVNYSDQGGEEISLALIRIPADKSTRQGSLLFNPGGPGGSGVDLIKIFDQIDSIPEPVMAAYDIVGFDPRGVGESTPVDCMASGFGDIDVYPVGEQAVRDMHQQISAAAEICNNKEGVYLQHLGSMNVVRDMDSIRHALGDQELNFIGYSYGTRLAALYLQEYPQNSGRIVLDGSMLPDSSVTKLVSDSLPALQSNLRLVLSQCTNTVPDCSVDQLVDRLTERVMTLAADNSDGAFEEFVLFGELIIASVQEPELGLFAADAIIEYLNTREVSVLENLVTLLQALGEDFEEEDDNATALAAVMCADDAWRPGADELNSLAVEMNNRSDVFAEAQLPLAALCSGWPEALEPLQPISTGAAPMSLVIGGTTDAQTPLQWSEAMAQAIGGVYIRSEHLGHTAVFTDESDCLDDLVEAFLLDGLAPVITECN